jgi:hypothetical protein
MDHESLDVRSGGSQVLWPFTPLERMSPRREASDAFSAWTVCALIGALLALVFVVAGCERAQAETHDCGEWRCASEECEIARRACERGGLRQLPGTLREMRRRADGGAR